MSIQELSNRYATEQMRSIWSQDRKFMIWRQIWIALAEAQMELGLKNVNGEPRITPEQIAQMRGKIDSFVNNDVEMNRLAYLEDQCRHDVMAHVRLLGEICPAASDILHLGATSCDITDNTDLILIRESMTLVRHRLVGVIDVLAHLAQKHIRTPCVAYTHYQPAQLTTVGKRICIWINDLLGDLRELELRIDGLALRGFKGASGTQASYLQLFEGSRLKVLEMERRVADKLGFKRSYTITGQTYPRKIDSFVTMTISGIAQSAHKFGTDIRLLQHDHEMQEPFLVTQVGSSAMPFKRNPVACERLCSLSRYLVNECNSSAQTAMNQWLERTLDDSAIRRIALPNIFLTADAILNVYLYIASGLQVNREIIRKNVWKELPFMLVETILMRAVRAGQDRQEMHEELRKECQQAQSDVAGGGTNDLLRNLRAHPVLGQFVNFSQTDFDPERYTGAAAIQAESFLRDAILPLRLRYPDSIGQKSKLSC